MLEKKNTHTHKYNNRKTHREMFLLAQFNLKLTFPFVVLKKPNIV